MITKVLVALNYLADTSEIFEQALAIAAQFQAQLYIFHCLEPEPTAVPQMSALAAYSGMLNTEAIAIEEELLHKKMSHISVWLQEQATQAENKGITVKADYKVGDSRAEICTAAKEWQADLVVVGRRGLQGISEMLIGSVSNYVVHHAPCSVLVVQS
ncbi:MAG: universal stress protein [Limnothrix sp.]